MWRPARCIHRTMREGKLGEVMGRGDVRPRLGTHARSGGVARSRKLATTACLLLAWGWRIGGAFIDAHGADQVIMVPARFIICVLARSGGTTAHACSRVLILAGNWIEFTHATL
jgi:hypothetical protein